MAPVFGSVRWLYGLSSRISRSKSKASRTQPPRVQGGSQPDLQISYTPAGHETMAAIAEELLSFVPASPRDSADEGPEVSISEAPAGRETLALIAGAAQPVPVPVRAEQSTLSYGDRISNAPGAKTPSLVPSPLHSVARTPAQSSAPEISIGESAVGRETLAVITAELVPSARLGSAPTITVEPSPSSSVSARAQTPTRGESANEAPFAIFEMLTFVVQGPETASLSSEALRRRFVEEHLLQRLPEKSMTQVDRVDVTPWTVRGTVVVRVWCKI
jgi:hypothetical protein